MSAERIPLCASADLLDGGRAVAFAERSRPPMPSSFVPIRGHSWTTD